MSDSELVADVLGGLGVDARPAVAVAHDGTGGPGHDLVVHPGGTVVEVVRRSLITRDTAARLQTKRVPHPARVTLVVADRVTHDARQFLLAHRLGYYDLRGHLALRTDHLVIDTDVAPVSEPGPPRSVLEGRAGLEVAVALLSEPGPAPGVRGLAARLGRSPSTVSQVLSGLTRDGLLDDRRRPVGTGLFWEVADRWARPTVFLRRCPDPTQPRISGPLKLGVDPGAGEGWALTGSLAAAAQGAPIAVRADTMPEFLVPDETALRRARTVLGTCDGPSEASCAIRQAPVAAACRNRSTADATSAGCPVAHPLFVALDLAQDAGRGHDVLRDWFPDDGTCRVW